MPTTDTIANVALFVREFGPPDAPAVVFLHGGLLSGWTWEPVVQRMPQYRCLVPDLPQYGKSFHQGPFGIPKAAAAVADTIRDRVQGGRAHLVGFSLGSQVGLQMLATEPALIDRAVLSSTFVNTTPAVQLTRRVAGVLARTAWFRWAVIDRFWDERQVAENDDYHDDARLNAGSQRAHIAEASAGFAVPGGLENCSVPTLFVTGDGELRLLRQLAARLADSMPHAIDRVATGMSHDWPVRNPDLFCRTVTAWLGQGPLPTEIARPT